MKLYNNLDHVIVLFCHRILFSLKNLEVVVSMYSLWKLISIAEQNFSMQPYHNTFKQY